MRGRAQRYAHAGDDQPRMPSSPKASYQPSARSIPRPSPRVHPADRARRQDSRDLATSLEDIAFALQKMRQAAMDGDEHELQKLIRDVTSEVQRLRQEI
jgi:hypothetical protein